ncbi:hypothetical protein [Abyssibacter profundi]|uniref:Uncharacterized protein n=1 Tax=Abyssibacter profundi TaxID=2182787 RepID=A0A363UQ77_9GAMM|nr:hypothetical protein [Abyssibacter profundi]MBV60007.1 hypothetical protein [Nevskiales bacterium]PWN57623.1 hypothetical protein DEH80_00325 [Abyssibacter profundi]
MLFKFVEDPAQNLALNMINTASRSIAQGIEATLLKYKWEQAGFDDESLSVALAELLADDLLEIHHAGDTPMLRFSAQAYESFVRANVYGALEQAAQLPDRPHEPSARPLTEHELRLAVLEIYRELSLGQQGLIPSSTLARFWREAERRAEDLRLAVDILLRDRFLEIVRREFDPQFRLTAAGAAYLAGPSAPAALIDRLGPADKGVSRCDRLSDRSLTRHLITLVDAPETDYPYALLAQRWQDSGLHGDWLVLGCDLLLKRGYLVLESETPLRLRLTPRGQDFREHAGKRLRRLGTRLAVRESADALRKLRARS